MNEKSNIDINFSAVFHSIVKKLWLILLVAVIAAVCAYMYLSFFIEPIYSSTATLYIGDNTSQDASRLNLSTYLTKDYEEIIKRRIVLDEVISELDLDMSYSQLRGCVSVYNTSNTRILDITVSTHDAVMSKNIADVICSVASQKIVSIVKVDYVNIVDNGSFSTVPSNINMPLTMFLAALAGMLICVFFIMVRALMDDKIKSPDDVEQYLGLSVLGSVPFDKLLVAEGNKKSLYTPTSPKALNDKQKSKS